MGTDVDPGDADQPERDWGIKVTVQMLHEGLISPKRFLLLCAEAAGADDVCRQVLPTVGSAGEQAQRSVRGGTAMSSAGCDEILRIIDRRLGRPHRTCAAR
jgi:hypothetical protein